MKMTRGKGLASAIIGLSTLGAATAQAGVTFSIGTGFVFGGGHCGWGGPIISIGTVWTSGSRGYDGWDDCGYRRGYNGWSRPCSDYYAPSYCGGAYSAPYCGPTYAAPCSPAVTVGAAVRIAEAPRPVAPAAPPESNVDRGWRLLEAGDTGAMEAFGRAVARSQSADAYLGYAICAARAGQNERAEWAARTALKKDPQVLAKAPAGAGVKAAAAEGLARYEQNEPQQNQAHEVTVALLSKAAGGATVGEVKAAAPGEPARLASRIAAAPAMPSAGAPPVSSPRPERRVVVAVKPDSR